MKKILILTSGYYPANTYGGPTASIRNLVNLLSNDYKFTILCNSYELNSDKNMADIEVNQKNEGKYGEDIYYLDNKHYSYSYIVQNLIDIEKFSLIYINSFFGIKQLSISLKINKKYSIPLLIAPRGEFEKNALKIKYYKKFFYIRFLKQYLKKKNIYFQATNASELSNINKIITPSKGKVFLLNNVPALSNSNNQDYFINTVKRKNHLNMCFIARIQTIKNLEYALSCLIDINPKYTVHYDIYGPIENEAYWNKCLNIIELLPNNITVTYKGLLESSRVQETFFNYDLFFMPTKSENFGHSIYESLSSNCPILISDQTPWTDINQTNGGKAFALDNAISFSSYIEFLASKDENDYKKIRISIKNFLNSKINIAEDKKMYILSFKKIMS